MKTESQQEHWLMSPELGFMLSIHTTVPQNGQNFIERGEQRLRSCLEASQCGESHGFPSLSGSCLCLWCYDCGQVFSSSWTGCCVLTYKMGVKLPAMQAVRTKQANICENTVLDWGQVVNQCHPPCPCSFCDNRVKCSGYLRQPPERSSFHTCGSVWDTSWTSFLPLLLLSKLCSPALPAFEL